ncbi:TIF1B factor, partial [Chauna torquata]|nr:TIF1B factor [Chauna torquata]
GGPVSTLLRKVPRVSLERLDLDLSGAAQPPAFRVFPGTSAEEFNLIIIERGAQPRPPPLLSAVKVGVRLSVPASFPWPRRSSHPAIPPPSQEEQQESAIGDAQDTKPVGLLPEHPRVLGPPEIPPGPGLAPSGTTRNVSCCRVCCQAGGVVMCDLCERCYHLDCHLPALQEVPGHDWLCLLCQDPPPPSEDLANGCPGPREGQPHMLCPMDQRKCEYVLLQLLCHDPWRPLHRLSSSLEGHDAIDLTLIRAKLQGKLSPGYG